jgi:DNA invertase Pin-like site-specific DNA recombinase
MAAKENPTVSAIRDSSWRSTQRTMALKISNFYSMKDIREPIFNRPAFKELMELVENDEVETIIVKDMSDLAESF